MKKIGLVCCSNGIDRKQENDLKKLEHELYQLHIDVQWSPFIYQDKSIKSASAQDRANIINQMNQDDSIDAIMDISGGDIANEILEYLDYTCLKKPFWGYSDLTTVINAIYSQTKRESVLFQIRHLVDNPLQIDRIQNKTLFDIDYQILQGKAIQGIIVGGNIRCLLKLAGTPYFPDMKEKILLLEAYSGDEAKIITYFNQLKQMGVFQQINGLLLGTYTQYFQKQTIIDLFELIKEYLPEDLTVVYSPDIGHSINAKAIMIGKEYQFYFLNKNY